MLITHRCPKAHCRAPIRTRADRAGRIVPACPRCHEQLALQIPEEMAAARLVNQCACCPGREFFIRKDFPQKFGFALVVLFGMAASIAYYYERVLVSFAVLGALVVIDALIFFFVDKVTVCYRCRAEYRGFAYNPDHEGFDLATSEKYG